MSQCLFTGIQDITRLDFSRMSWSRLTRKIPELFLLSLREMYSSLWDCPNKGADLVYQSINLVCFPKVPKHQIHKSVSSVFQVVQLIRIDPLKMSLFTQSGFYLNQDHPADSCCLQSSEILLLFSEWILKNLCLPKDKIKANNKQTNSYNKFYQNDVILKKKSR